MGLYGLDWFGSGYGPAEGSVQDGYEPSHFTTFWEVLR
jgi:hypothetical protein